MSRSAETGRAITISDAIGSAQRHLATAFGATSIR